MMDEQNGGQQLERKHNFYTTSEAATSSTSIGEIKSGGRTNHTKHRDLCVRIELNHTPGCGI
ncbi:hypothetical protein BRADI_1g56755v3 [Brachypodium distachyon]|uniref:Uncharacterized protein n=1 Tax=Brachypodium distachyon TaxID=15368 RepID=A0A0Q3LCI1_BRADI|nr:hypothetical protein BRADI_1g56755v3 [Brachypodium distachyon]